MIIYVDADACPVKDEVIRVAARYSLSVVMVSGQGLRPSAPHVQNVMVGDKFDAADDWIAERITAADIAITADIPLASRCLKNGAKVLNPNGRPFTQEGIGSALAMRDLNAYLREAGEIKGHNPSFTKQNRSDFLQVLDRIIQQSMA